MIQRDGGPGVYQTVNQCWERANLGHGPRGTNSQCLVQKFWSQVCLNPDALGILEFIF